MKTRQFILAAFFLVGALGFVFSDDTAKKIADKGEAEWQNLITDLKAKNLFIENVSAKTLVADFAKYKGSAMIFPKIDFSKTYTDRNGKQYFYCSEPDFDGFVIEYNRGITDKIRKYSYIVGGLSSENWQLLGSVENFYDWWGNVVFLKIKAIRVPGQITAVIDNDEIKFIGEDLLELKLADLAKDPFSDVPKKLKNIPAGLDSLIVAKLFYYLCIVEDNQAVWEKLLTKDNFYRDKLDTAAKSWWKTMKKNESYFYVRLDREDANQKRYYFQAVKDGKNLGTPKPITVTKEAGEWKVSSATP
jgi:hypothetical protein